MAAAGQSQAVANTPPTAADVLRWVAAVSPHLWYPSHHAAQAGIPRNSLDEPLWILRQTGLVQVGDWVKDVGQGFRLTPEGEQAVGQPNPVPIPPPQHRPPPDPIPPETDDLLHHSPHSAYAIGETARQSLFDPPPAVVTPILLVMNVVWFLFGGVLALQERAVSDYLRGGQHPGVMEILLRIGGVSGVELLDGDWWRLLTSGFVHIGLFHLLCNMVTLGLLGTVAEGVWGRWRFILIYLMAGLASSVTAMALHPQTESAGGMQDVLLGGASGSLWGLTAALAVWLLSNLKHLPADVGPDWMRKLMLIVVMNVVVSFQPGVSLEGHLGGGVCGVLVALCLGRIRGDHRETVGAVLGLVLVVIVFATGFGLAFTRSNDWREVKARWSAQQSPPVVPPNRLQDAPTR